MPSPKSPLNLLSRGEDNTRSHDQAQDAAQQAFSLDQSRRYSRYRKRADNKKKTAQHIDFFEGRRNSRINAYNFGKRKSDESVDKHTTKVPNQDKPQSIISKIISSLKLLFVNRGEDKDKKQEIYENHQDETNKFELSNITSLSAWDQNAQNRRKIMRMKRKRWMIYPDYTIRKVWHAIIAL